MNVLEQTRLEGNRVFICGNGGSASDSAHIVGELMKGFKSRRPLNQRQVEALEFACPGEGKALADHLQQTIKAIALTDQAAISTAFANDVDPNMVFAQQVLGYGRRGDVLIGLSTSGTVISPVPENGATPPVYVSPSSGAPSTATDANR